MQKLDQKQKMQVVVLGVLAVGLFGYFAMQMVKVTPAAAKTQTASTPAPARVSTPSKAAAAAPAVPGKPGAATSTTVADAAQIMAPPPAPNMRDPFIPGLADEASIEAYQKSLQTAKQSPDAPSVKNADWNKPVAPFVAPLPKPGDGLMTHPADLSVAPLPQPVAAAPAWTVTGVVDGGGGGSIAILRNGDARRMVRAGDMVDNFRVVEIGRSNVVFAADGKRYTLPLGGARPPAPPAPGTTVPTESTQGTAAMPAASTTMPSPTVPPSTSTGPQPSTPPSTNGGGDTNLLMTLPGGLKLPIFYLPAM